MTIFREIPTISPVFADRVLSVGHSEGEVTHEGFE